jgi:hypothetical protein
MSPAENFWVASLSASVLRGCVAALMVDNALSD